MLWQKLSRPQRFTPRGVVGMPNFGRPDYLSASEKPAHAGRWLT